MAPRTRIALLAALAIGAVAVRKKDRLFQVPPPPADQASAGGSAPTKLEEQLLEEMQAMRAEMQALREEVKQSREAQATAPGQTERELEGQLLPDSALHLASQSGGDEPEHLKMLVGPHVETVAEGDPGYVDYIFTMGAPGGASPGLKNMRVESRCFPGVRIYQWKPGRWWGTYADVAAMAGNFAFYWHSWMDAMKMDGRDGSHEVRACTGGETFLPIDTTPDAGLHLQETYIKNVRDGLNDPYITNMSTFAARTAYMHNSTYVADVMQNHYGWGLVGSAIHPGGDVYGGAQVAHLIQRPDTLECVLTFQGSIISVPGWIANFDTIEDHFCGFTDPDETCGSLISTCTVRHEGGSFVHGGFKHRLMSMLSVTEFQRDIRPNLGKCNRLTVVGHSLGGAVAEFFAACNAKAPKEGEHGFADYDRMSWTKEAPARLPYIGANGQPW